MLYREIIAVYSQIHTKHINTLCGQNVELLNVKPGGRNKCTLDHPANYTILLKGPLFFMFTNQQLAFCSVSSVLHTPPIFSNTDPQVPPCSVFSIPPLTLSPLTQRCPEQSIAHSSKRLLGCSHPPPNRNILQNTYFANTMTSKVL